MSGETWRVVEPDGSVNVLRVQRAGGDMFIVHSDTLGREHVEGASFRCAVERFAGQYLGVAEIRGPGEATTAERVSAAEATAHQLTMERDGARLSLDAAHEARIKQSLELAEARAQLDAAHAHIAVLERVAFTACGHDDDLGEKLSEREEQIAARDEADAKVLRVEADWYRARRSVADLRGFVATMRAYHGVELIGVDVSAAVAMLDAIEDAARVHFAGSAR